MTALALLAAVVLSASDRQARFLDLLRTYPSRPPAESVALVSELVEQGPFAERDRALYWIGSVRLQSKDLAGARGYFARLRAEYADSPWVERAILGEADAATIETDYASAMRWLATGANARDPAVRELSRLQGRQVETLRARLRYAWAAGLFALGVLLILVGSVVRRWPVPLLPLPFEARLLLPLLAVLSLLSLRQDPAPRAAVLEICAAGAVLSVASGLSLRARRPPRWLAALQGVSMMAALACCAYAAIFRADLINMVLETFRAGPE